MPDQRPSASVSVVLCTYNGAAHLGEQLDSIANQTLQPAEMIVCDDGSTDTTMDLLEAFKQRATFPVVIVRNPTNLGSTANFDGAMQRATGKFLALADQDDIWLPHKLATLVPLLENDPTLGGVFSDARLLDTRRVTGRGTCQQTLFSMRRFNDREQSAFAGRDGAVSLLLRADLVTGATMVVRADLRPLWHPIPTSWVHDGWVAWILTVESQIRSIAEPLMIYRLHDEQQLGLGAGQSTRERIAFVRRSERARYARVAQQYEDLRERLELLGPHRILDERLRAKIELLRRRAALPYSNFHRAVAILRLFPAYSRYARGWRSMRKDLFLA